MVRPRSRIPVLPRSCLQPAASPIPSSPDAQRFSGWPGGFDPLCLAPVLRALHLPRWYSAAGARGALGGRPGIAIHEETWVTTELAGASERLVRNGIGKDLNLIHYASMAPVPLGLVRGPVENPAQLCDRSDQSSLHSHSLPRHSSGRRLPSNLTRGQSLALQRHTMPLNDMSLSIRAWAEWVTVSRHGQGPGLDTRTWRHRRIHKREIKGCTIYECFKSCQRKSTCKSSAQESRRARSPGGHSPPSPCSFPSMRALLI